MCKLYQKKSKKTYNPGHNIFEIYNVLVQIPVATSKAKLDMQYNKLGVQVAPRVAERLKTWDLRKLGNIGKILNSGGHIAHCPDIPFQKLNFGNSSQKTRKSRNQTFLFLLNFTGFFYFGQIICPGLQAKKEKSIRVSCTVDWSAKIVKKH